MDAYNRKNLIAPMPGFDEGRRERKMRVEDYQLLEESRVYLQNPIDVPQDTYNLTPDHVNVCI